MDLRIKKLYYCFSFSLSLELTHSCVYTRALTPLQTENLLYLFTFYIIYLGKIIVARTTHTHAHTGPLEKTHLYPFVCWATTTTTILLDKSDFESREHSDPLSHTAHYPTIAVITCHDCNAYYDDIPIKLTALAQIKSPVFILIATRATSETIQSQQRAKYE